MTILKKIIIFNIILFLNFNIIFTMSVDSHQLNEDSTGLFIYVDSSNVNGPWDGSIKFPYKTIKSGYHASTSGDTILIQGGIYNETFSILKNGINIKGLNQSGTIIQSENNQYIFSILGKM